MKLQGKVTDFIMSRIKTFILLILCEHTFQKYREEWELNTYEGMTVNTAKTEGDEQNTSTLSAGVKHFLHC